jgi:hypothetical protein
MTCSSIAANTTLVLLELIFEVVCLRQICSRHALVELLSKWYHGSPNNSEIRLRLLDNCYNLYYRDETSNLDVTEEIFTFLTINNLNLVETGGLVDFSLVLGNHVDSYLYGLLAVSNVWYRSSLTKLFLFWVCFVYSFVHYNQ